MSAVPADHWEPVIRRFGLAGAGAVLDVACGSGDWLAQLGRVNSRVVGTDIDERLLDLARTRASGAANVEVRAMPAESLELPDREFDAVTCLTALPYLEQAVALGEMARVLKPGGRLVVGTVGSGYYAKHVAAGIRHQQRSTIRYGLDAILVGMGRTIRGPRFAPTSVRAWTPRAVRRLLDRHGFTVDRVDLDVDAVDPSWPKRFLGRPLYFVVFATRRGQG
jgi:SAM-dependent methyltransferase